MKKSTTLIIALLLCLLLLVGCGSKEEQPIPTAEPTPTVEPTPEPTPVPTPEPKLTAYESITFNGIALECSYVDESGLIYAELQGAAEAMGIELEQQDKLISFIWRGEEALLQQDSAELQLGGSSFTLAGKVISVGGKLYFPVESFCEQLKISLYYDAEFAHLYCTPAAGDWEVPEGYKIPVFMYHAVAQPWAGDPALDVWPSDIEKQLQYLQDNGYETIFFEDIAHIQDYEKPVILTFDDGYLNNYEDLYPILERFQAKATFFIVTNYMKHPGYNYMNSEQVAELSRSGLVDIQSHTVNHHFLDMRAEDALHLELGESKLELLRLTGKEPYVLCYPSGMENEHVREVATEEYNYNFGLKMTGDVYVTGQDPMLIYRYYVIRELDIERYAEMLEREPAEEKGA